MSAATIVDLGKPISFKANNKIAPTYAEPTSQVSINGLTYDVKKDSTQGIIDTTQGLLIRSQLC